MYQKLSNPWFLQISVGIQCSLIVVWSTLGYMPSAFAQTAHYPDWWKSRQVVDNDAAPEVAEDNKVVANIGQLKWMVTQAKNEIEALTPRDENGELLLGLTDLDDDLTRTVKGFENEFEDWSRGNQTAVALGQVKAAALPFYRYLNLIRPAWVRAQLESNGLVYQDTFHPGKGKPGHVTGYYPWDPATDASENKQATTLGQLKLIFALNLRLDAETGVHQDGIPDLFEYALLKFHPAFLPSGAYYEEGRTLTIANITRDSGDALLKIVDHQGNELELAAGTTEPSLPTPFPNLAAASASVSALLSEHEAVGAVSGSFEVGADGAAVYTMPIDIPTGTAGMAPKLAMAYSSRGGNGALGVGFDLTGLQRITRGAASLENDGFIDGTDFDANDRFFLDGERLVCINGTYGADGAQYRTQNDSFAKVISHGSLGSGPAWWEVYTKSGLRLYFGSDGINGGVDSCVNAPRDSSGNTPGVLAWGICRAVDTLGNYYQVSYERDGGNQNSNSPEAIDYRPGTIRYTGKLGAGALAPYNLIEFIYEDRNDSSTGYLAGVKLQATQRLAAIRIAHDPSGNSSGDENYRYQIDYADEAFPNWNAFLAQDIIGQSRMVSVTRVLPNGEALPPTEISWDGVAKAPLQASSYDPPIDLAADDHEDLGTRMIDLDGDGLTDLLYGRQVNSSTQHRVAYLNTGSGWQQATQWKPPIPIASDDDGDIGVRLEDLNGDGLIDMIQGRWFSASNQQYRAYLNTGNGWEQANQWAPPIHLAADDLGDLGTRFIDVNGDGLVDLLYGRWLDADTQYYAAYLNTGNGWQQASQWEPPIAFAADEHGDLGTRLQDVNGDGLVDILYGRHRNADNQYYAAYLNTGNGWQASEEWKPPVHFVADDIGDMGVRLVDVNGDNLVDILWGRYLTPTNQRYQAYLNTGKGWKLSPEWKPPVHFVADDIGDMGVRIGDVNGDGLVDLLWGRWLNSTNQRYQAYLNTGNGWKLSPEWSPPVHFARDNEGDQGTRLVDLNGDGILDILYGRWQNSSTQHRDAFLSTGKGWGSSLNKAVEVDQRLITEITDGLGATIKVEYKRLNEKNTATEKARWGGPEEWKTDIYSRGAIDPQEANQGIIRLATSRVVVSRYAEEDGVGGYRWRRNHYKGLKIDRENQIRLGFEEMTVVDEQRMQRSTGHYLQNYPYHGRVKLRESFYWDPTQDQEICLSSEQFYHHQWPVRTGNSSDPEAEIRFLYVKQVLAFQCDSRGQRVSASFTNQVYPDDQFGHSTTSLDVTMPYRGAPFEPAGTYFTLAEVEGKASSGDRLRTYTTNTYLHNTSKWYLGRLTTGRVAKTLTRADGTTDVSVRNSAFAYYMNSHGMILRETVEPGTDFETRTTTYYDDYGNTTKSLTNTFDGRGGRIARFTSASFVGGTNGEEPGRFAITASNQVGHTTTNRYDPKRALHLSTTDPNGLTTTYGYDRWGTQILTRTPAGLETVEITKWARNNSHDKPPGVTSTWKPPGFVGASPFAQEPEITFIRRTQSSGSAPATLFIDSQGREVMACTLALRTVSPTGASTHKTVYSRTAYDELGRELATTQPFYSGESILFNFVEFDHLDRVAATCYADGTKETMLYNYEGDSLRALTKNRKGFYRIRQDNVLEQMIESCDCGASSTRNDQNVTFRYDAEGRVITSTAVGGHVVTNTYDLLGNKIATDDPDTGPGWMNYNGFGEVLSSGSGPIRGQNYILYATFDALGRQAARYTYNSSGDVEYYTRWLYDDSGASTGWKGALRQTLHYKVGTTSELISKTTPTYDHLGRDSVTTETILGKSYTASTTYDELARVRTETDAAGLRILHRYDEQGFQTGLIDYDRGTVYHQARVLDSQGNITQQRLGNGVETVQTYDRPTGMMRTIHSTVGQTVIQDLSFGWDSIANLRFRENALNNRHERFAYDDYSRLVSDQVGVGSSPYSSHTGLNAEPTLTKDYGYDATGNITKKAGLISPNYQGHRLTSFQRGGKSHTLAYDSRGRITEEKRAGAAERSFQWTSFGQLKRVEKFSDTLFNGSRNHANAVVDYEFNSTLTRLSSTKTVYYDVASGGGHQVTESIYLGSVEQVRETKYDDANTIVSDQSIDKHYIGGVAILEQTRNLLAASNAPPTTEKTKYLLKDHIGSTETITDEYGAVLEQVSLDAWGQQRDTDTWGQADSISYGQSRSIANTTRGFTGHEHFDEVGLTHMNGRVYDPLLGRFLSPDAFVQAPERAQNFNRYSYVLNNPLSLTDPSGHFFLGLIAAFAVKVAVVAAIAAIATPILNAIGKWLAEIGILDEVKFLVSIIGIFLPAQFAFVSSAINSALSGGSTFDVIKGAVLDLAFRDFVGPALHDFKVGTSRTSGLTRLAGQTLHTAAHGIWGGVRNVAVGGKFSDGFLSASVSSAASHLGIIEAIGGSGSSPGNVIARTLAAGVIGGLAAEVGGGKFANGFVTASYQHLLNDEIPQKYKDAEAALRAKISAQRSAGVEVIPLSSTEIRNWITYWAYKSMDQNELHGGFHNRNFVTTAFFSMGHDDPNIFFRGKNKGQLFLFTNDGNTLETYLPPSGIYNGSTINHAVIGSAYGINDGYSGSTLSGLTGSGSVFVYNTTQSLYYHYRGNSNAAGRNWDQATGGGQAWKNAGYYRAFHVGEIQYLRDSVKD